MLTVVGTLVTTVFEDTLVTVSVRRITLVATDIDVWVTVALTVVGAATVAVAVAVTVDGADAIGELVPQAVIRTALAAKLHTNFSLIARPLYLVCVSMPEVNPGLVHSKGLKVPCHRIVTINYDPPGCMCESAADRRLTA